MTTIAETAITTIEQQGFRMTRVHRVKDAIGAYCLTCQRGIGEPWQVHPWSWRKSQMLHERSTGHKTIMYAFK